MSDSRGIRRELAEVDERVRDAGARSWAHILNRLAEAMNTWGTHPLRD